MPLLSSVLVLYATISSAVQPVRLRVNAQQPAWSQVCPPPADHDGADEATHCVNAHEAQGLPTTGLRLTWELTGMPTSQRGVRQIAYEAEISCLRTGVIVWSTKAAAEDFAALAMPEPALQPESSYGARVRVSWVIAGSANDNTTTWTDWSDPALFDTRPSVDSWAARESEWIGGFPQLRSSFSVPSSASISRARLYAVGLGSFVVSLNGLRVGDHILDPPQTAYPVRTLFSSYNVTERLRSGENVVGVLLGRYKYGYMDVWCNLTAAGHAEGACRSFRMQLVVEMADGSVISHVSTSRSEVAAWVGRQGPIVYDHEYHGEQYDRRMQVAGWNNFSMVALPNAKEWKPVVAVPAVRVEDAVLAPQQMPPIKIVETRTAVSITKLDVDLKQHITRCSAASGHIGGEMPEDQFGTGRLTMTCANGKIARIDFANFGTAHLVGDCQSAQMGPCVGANNTKAVVEHLCLGKSSCSVSPRVGQFGGVDPCPDIKKTLVVIASGCTPKPAPPPPKLPANETSYVFGETMQVLCLLCRPASVPLSHSVLSQKDFLLPNEHAFSLM